MRKAMLSLFPIILFFGGLQAQTPLNQIEGFLEVYLPQDTTSMYIGWKAGRNVSSLAQDNVFLGSEAGRTNLNGRRNTFLGHQAGAKNNGGNNNSFFGNQAGYNNENGDSNTFIGREAGNNNRFGSCNVFVGSRAADSNRNGNDQVIIGGFAGANSRNGGESVVIGQLAAQGDTSMLNSVYIGYRAGGLINNTTSREGNVFIGNSAGLNHTGSNRLFIANSGVDSTEALIYGEFDNKLLQINGRIRVRNDRKSGLTIAGLLEAPLSKRPVLLFSEGGDSFNNGMSIEYDGRDSGGDNNLKINKTGGSPLMTFKNNGDVGIGTIAPVYKLDVAGDAFFLNDITTGGTIFLNNVLPGAGVSDLRLASDGEVVMSTSDVRLKKDIVTIPDALAKVLQLRGVQYLWKQDVTEGIQLGVIAQEVKEVVPEIVNEVNGLYGVDYSETAGLFIEAIKEQQKMIKVQNDEITYLKSLLNSALEEIEEIKIAISTE